MDLSRLKHSRLVHVCFAITFFTSGVIVNLVQCLFYLTVRPINKTVYRKINWYFCFTIYSQLVFLGDWWSNSRIKIYIDREEFDKYYGKEHAYCIMNHTYEIDWLIGWMFCDRIQCLGNCKAYAKKVIQYIPVLGWGWKCAEFVFLERSFDKDKEIINRQITELAEHPDPIWDFKVKCLEMLVNGVSKGGALAWKLQGLFGGISLSSARLLLFPEGTRFTPAKHKISLDFAKQKNLPELKHHLLPRTKGFTASLPSMRGKVPAVYDIEIAFKEDDPYKPTIRSMLFGQPVVAHMYMRRIPLEDLPESEIEQEQFLRDLFIRKDKLKDSFIKTGDFFATSGIPRIEPFEVDRKINSVINLAIWVVVILCPIGYYLIKLLFSGELLYFSIGVSIIGAFFVLMNKTIGMSEIKKGSSYGTGTPKKTD